MTDKQKLQTKGLIFVLVSYWFILQHYNLFCFYFCSYIDFYLYFLPYL